MDKDTSPQQALPYQKSLPISVGEIASPRKDKSKSYKPHLLLLYQTGHEIIICAFTGLVLKNKKNSKKKRSRRSPLNEGACSVNKNSGTETSIDSAEIFK